MTSKTQQDYIYIRAFLSILPLVNPNTVFEIVSDLSEEAEKTRFSPTMRRFSSFGLTLSFVGGVALAVFLIEELIQALQNIRLGDVPIGNIGIYPLSLAGALSLAFMAKMVLRQMQKVDDATSPIANETDTVFAGVFEFVFGAIFFAMLGSILVQINIWEFLYFVALAALIVGIVVSAIGLTFSGTLNLGGRVIRFFREDRQDGDCQSTNS